jgi:hypothetical protein
MTLLLVPVPPVDDEAVGGRIVGPEKRVDGKHAARRQWLEWTMLREVS